MGKGKIAAIAACTCAALAIAGFALHVHGQASDYAEAERLAEAGDAQGAYAIYEGLGGYSDARERARALADSDPSLPYRNVAKGDLVTFGSWEQDGNMANGPEPIEWIVLDKVDGCLLLLSATCLDGRSYNPVEFQSVTWEECELRSWLNSDFLEGAFTDAELSLIPAVENVNEDRIGAADEDDPMREYFVDGGAGTEQMGVGGADTRDRVFLLSETDTLIYLNDDISRETVGKARLADAAATRDVFAGEDGCVGWWLRSPGVYAFTAQFVNEDGEPYPAGAYVELSYGVRPVLWLNVGDSDDAGGVR